MMLALAFERLGPNDVVTRLTTAYFERSSLTRDLDVAAALSASMSRARRITESLRLADALDDPADEALDHVSMLFTFPAMGTPSP
jgi:hypothetical protein